MILTPGEAATARREQSRESLFPSGNAIPFVLVTALFFLWGKFGSLSLAYLLPLGADVFIAYYGFAGSKLRRNA